MSREVNWLLRPRSQDEQDGDNDKEAKKAQQQQERSEMEKRGMTMEEEGSSTTAPGRQQQQQGEQEQEEASSAPSSMKPQPEELSADELRRRRLARFGSSPTSTTSASSCGVPGTGHANHSGSAPAATQPMDIERTPSLEQTRPPSLMSSASSPNPLDASSLSPLRGGVVPYLQWEHETLKRIFRIALTKREKKNDYVLIEDVARDIEEDANDTMQDHPPLLSVGVMERSLVSRLSVEPKADEVGSNYFDYLVGCFRIAHNESERSINKNNNVKAEVFKAVFQLIVSYTGLILKYPDAWPQTMSMTREDVARQFLACMQVEPISVNAFPTNFLDHMLAHHSKEDTREIFTYVLDELSFQMKATNLLGSFVPLYQAFTILVKYKPIASLLVSLPNWIPKPNIQSGKEMETNSFLGPFFRLTPCPPDTSVRGHYFLAPSAMSQQNIDTAFSAIRHILVSSQQSCFEGVKLLLKASPETKEGVLEWISVVLNRNVERTRIQADRRSMSSDGFMLNLSAVLLSFCVPFISPASPKLDLIETSCLLLSSRLQSSSDTKLGATSDEVQQHLEKISGRKKRFSFITECFFLTLRSLHLGMLRTFGQYSGTLRAELEQKAIRDTLVSRQEQEADNPEIHAEITLLLERLNAQIDEITRDRLCIEAQLAEPTVLDRAARFFIFVASWMSHLVELESHGLPLKNPPSPEVVTLPEYFVEDICDFFIFISKFMTNKLLEFQGLDGLLSFLTAFLASPNYIKNPYLRAKIVEVLLSLTPKQADKLDIYGANKLASTHLPTALMSFYVDIEFTGRSSSFYDKFTHRYHIASLVKYLWQLPDYRSSIANAASDSSNFLKFVNAIINDAIYLLDESLSKLSEIRSYQIEMQNKEAWSQQDAETRREREHHFRTLERQVKTYLLLGNQTIKMLYYLTTDIVEPFLRPDVVDRLASMLNYFLDQLAGPKCLTLKVDQPEKYGFKPRLLLHKIAVVYIHLASRELVEAVAGDSRSYSDAVFSKAASVLRNDALLSEEEVKKFEDFAGLAREHAQRAQAAEDTLGEIPDEFLDPILQTLMKDPVILPSSGKTMDRTVISRHLLSTPFDPFNRSPLSVDMLRPDEELKRQIDEFLQSKRTEGKKEDRMEE